MVFERAEESTQRRATSIRDEVHSHTRKALMRNACSHPALSLTFTRLSGTPMRILVQRQPRRLAEEGNYAQSRLATLLFIMGSHSTIAQRQPQCLYSFAVRSYTPSHRYSAPAPLPSCCRDFVPPLRTQSQTGQ